jgi:threonine/homoserine/homoserine lactone efflux protein
MITPAYLLACIGLLIVPGPTVIFVITRGVALGRKAALLVVIGNLLAGTARHWLTRSSRAMGTLRWVSGATFIGLGVRLALQEK